ncbi:Hypothetical predicted protein [Mytilus galloprovincialis]|uniref:Uncharacterized protein n=1 Tax=Mytilus galloprovincialis TaxID=29158 RepID=A0A8B6BK04_MYTGA|nr:Hypothetical predicted protein [Mytilus galloprovincialis]
MDDNSYASDLSLSFQRPSFESIEEVDRPIVAEDDIQPYQFEPKLSDGNSDDGKDNASLDGDDDMEQRLGNTNWRNRYTAYRQLARRCWGYLGKSVRVHLPACATLEIMKTFPSNQYKGFEEA